MDTRAVYNTLIGSSKLQEQLEKLDEKEARAAATEQEKADQPKQQPKKLKRKLKLQPNSKETPE